MGFSGPIAQVRKLASMKKREAVNRRTSWNCAEANSRRRRDNSLRRPPACFYHASSDACRHPRELLGSERSSQVKATHGRTQRDPLRCKSIEQQKGRRRKEASSMHVAMLTLLPLKTPFEGNRPLQPHFLQKGGLGKQMVPRPANPERDSESGSESERSIGM